MRAVNALARLCLVLGTAAGHITICHAEDASNWVLSASAEQTSVGRNLPVLALQQPDWPNYLTERDKPGRAFQTLKAELSARHTSGWRVATFARGQAWLNASADAVTLAAAQAQNANPDQQRAYAPTAQSQSWAGYGLTLGTPWWPVVGAEHWQWQADVSLLQLNHLRLAELGGSLTYKGNKAYDFDLWSQRSNPDITGRFLPASGTSGNGATLSIAIRAQPWPGWVLTLRGDDLVSTLRWQALATDANTLRSANTVRRADGYLDYTAYLQGKKSLLPVTSQIEPHWQLNAQRLLALDDAASAAFTWQISRQAGINQNWFGLRSGALPGTPMHWRVALEPSWPALQFEANWRGWQLTLATDGKGADTQYRQLKLGWSVRY